MRTAVSKIVRRDDGALVALCGSQSLGLAMIDSIFGEAAWPTATTDEGATIIVVKPGEPAIFYSSERKIAMPVEQGWMTWGSGREFAAGALLMGADAKRAVEITNQLCNGCGLGVQVERPGLPDADVPEHLRPGFKGGAFPAGTVPQPRVDDGRPLVDWPKSDPRLMNY